MRAIFKHTGVAITAALFTHAAAAQEGGPQHGPQHGPSPQALATLGTLGGSGVLEYLMSDATKGLQLSRIGASRNNVNFGDSQAPGKALPEFRDRDRALVMPLSVMKEIPSTSGVNFLRFALSYTRGDGGSGVPLENDGYVASASLHFLHAPDPSTIYGVALIYDKTDIDNLINSDAFGSRGETSRAGWGVQLSYGKDFQGPWAMSSKVEYQMGKTDFRLDYRPSPVTLINIDTLNQSDDRLYMESFLIGTYAAPGALREDWALHPVIGATFQRNYIGEVTNSLGVPSGGETDDYGMVTAKVTLSKSMKPSPALQVLPSFGIGLEHEYTNDLDSYLSDRTYGVASIGVTFSKMGQQFNVAYTHYEGLDGNRSQNVLTAVLGLTF